MDAMQKEFERFFDYLRAHASEITSQQESEADSESLIPISRLRVLRYRQQHPDEN